MVQTPKSETPDRQANSADTSDAAIGRRLREARDSRGFTQQQVSARSKLIDPEEKGVSRTALIGYEAGTSRPGTRELRILCETLHVTPNVLIYGSEQPFQASHVALEGLRDRRRQLIQALQVAFVVMALRDHEKDALLSVALSLGGHHLGDERLSGLRGMALLLSTSVEGEIRSFFEGVSDTEFDAMPLSEIAQRLSRQLSMNIGTRLRFDEDGDIIGGEQTYPDPEG
ncbi:helix-turn-helix domain-containing protein [Ideonella sp.]|uniref:helix-turn-helix domain-containing protein n=1 Tax=Ideonella sp. TaxID=1929293 RepID=UPI0035B1A24D